MYTNISDEFKEIVNSKSIKATAKLVFTSPNITIYSSSTDLLNSSIQEISITDNCYNDGSLVGTAMTKEVEIKLINKDNLDLADKEFELFVGVVLSDGEYEYIPYGKYIITKYEDTKSNNIFKIIAYDYMNKLNDKFQTYVSTTDIALDPNKTYYRKVKLDNSYIYELVLNPVVENIDNYYEKKFDPEFPISLKDFKQQFLRAYEIDYEDQDLANDNFIINQMPNFDGYTIRAIIGKIAELQGTFAKINRENKMEFYLKNETTETIDDMSMNSKLEIDKQYGPVNAVCLALENVEGENVTIRDYKSIEANGQTMITIFDNPFVYTEELRELAIQELFEALNGFSYVPTKFNYKARLYTDCGDTISVQNVDNGEFVNSIILNQYIKIPATRQSELENLALSDTAIKNQYISKSRQSNTHTELSVNKQTNEILGLIETTSDLSTKTVSLREDVDTIKASIGTIVDVTKTEEGYGSIHVDEIRDSEPLYIRIYPTNEDIIALSPKTTLFPSETLFPSNSRELVFTRTNEDKEPYIEKYDIPIPLYKFHNIYDEFILDYEIRGCYVIKRIGIDEYGQKYVLPMEKREVLPYPFIKLDEGNYDISLPLYPNAYIYIRLMGQNAYTSQYATKVELESKIEVTENKIDIGLSEKLDGKEFTGANILLAINKDESEAQIQADKINLNGVVTANEKFKVNLDGSVETTDLKLADGGRVIGGDGLRTNLFFSSTGEYQGYTRVGFMSNYGQFEFYYSDVAIDIAIPENFTPTNAILTLEHTPIDWGTIEYQGKGWARNLKLYKGNGYYTYDFSAMEYSPTGYNGYFDEIPNAFGSASYTPSNSDHSTKNTVDLVLDLDGDYITSGNYQLIIRSANSLPSIEANSEVQTGLGRAYINIIGYMKYNQNQEEGDLENE